jgi:hypothetical protein
MHILFWRKNEKFRKSRNNQNSFFKKLISLTKKNRISEGFFTLLLRFIVVFFFNLFKKYIFKVNFIYTTKCIYMYKTIKIAYKTLNI